MTNAKKQVLERLLKIPENRQNGVLQPGDFDLLRLVYQKPLWDMGKDLAQKLMEGSNQTGFMNPDVTLGTSELIELTALIQKKNDPSYAIRFSPLKLRQIETDMERQRIRAIKVTAVKCRQLGQKMPDNITFKFILVGKSVVRSGKRLFAFDPDMKRGKNKEDPCRCDLRDLCPRNEIDRAPQRSGMECLGEGGPRANKRYAFYSRRVPGEPANDFDE